MVRSSPSYKCVQNFDVSAGSTLTGYNKCKAQQVKSSTKIEEVWGGRKETETPLYKPHRRLFQQLLNGRNRNVCG